jgi:hypothetical protein
MRPGERTVQRGGEGGREEGEGTYCEEVVHGGAARREEQADGDERERERGGRCTVGVTLTGGVIKLDALVRCG